MDAAPAKPKDCFTRILDVCIRMSEGVIRDSELGWGGALSRLRSNCQ